MANQQHIDILKQGKEAWNKWREDNKEMKSPDLSGANITFIQRGLTYLRQFNLSGADLSSACLSETDLCEADLSDANLSEADLNNADLAEADFSRADLSGANLSEAYLREACFSGAYLHGTDLRNADCYGSNLSGAYFTGADLSGANLSGADLREANLSGANLSEVNLSNANLSGANLKDVYLGDADLSRANLSGVNFSRADLSRANLRWAILFGVTLLESVLSEATLDNCKIYGISVWNIKGQLKSQKNLVITPPGEAEITVDDIKVAQFVYLLLNNAEIRNVLDVITAKAVLIIGRYTEERKKTLDAIREALRAKGYLPILFDFKGSPNRDFTETIRILAGLSRFVIADITDAKAVPVELQAIVPDFPSIPVKPVILQSQMEYAMFSGIKRYPWVLEVYEYATEEVLLANLEQEIINPAEQKAEELRIRR